VTRVAEKITTVVRFVIPTLSVVHIQSSPSGKAKCHSLTKNGNVRNLTNGRISLHGHPRAILTRFASCQSATHMEKEKEQSQSIWWSPSLSSNAASQQNKQSNKRRSLLRRILFFLSALSLKSGLRNTIVLRIS
jgi:hypothetical protein